MKPYYEQDGVTIYHGDCLEVLESVAPFSEVVLTDPPYNVGIEYDGHNDNMDRMEYAEWCHKWWFLCRHLAQRIVVFPGHGNVGLWYESIARPSAIGCWYKPGNRASSIIGWEEWEPWLFWTGNKGMLGGSSVITAPTMAQSDAKFHPTPKPVLLMSKLLRKTRAASVLDPFAGSGATLVAAKRAGIPAVGIEKSERYCEGMAERLSQNMLPLESIEAGAAAVGDDAVSPSTHVGDTGIIA